MSFQECNTTLSQSEISGNPHIPHVTRGHSVRYQERLSEGLSGELSSQGRRRGMGLFMLRSPDIRCARQTRLENCIPLVTLVLVLAR